MPLACSPRRAMAWAPTCAALLALVGAGACTVEGPPTDPTTVPPRVTVVAAPDSLYLSERDSLVAQVASAAGGAVNVTWSSSDTTVVAVSDPQMVGPTSTATGYVFARALGRATLTVRVRSGILVSEASVTVTVRGGPRLGLWPDTNALVPGLARTLVARDLPPAQPPGAALAGAQWSTDAPGVATVDAAGRVTAVAPGRAIISAVVGDRRASAVVVVRDYGGPLRFTALVSGVHRAFTPMPHTCGLVADGRAFCWGSNLVNALGGTGPMDRCERLDITTGGGSPPRYSTVRYRCSATPVEVDGGLRFAQLSAYAAHTCGLTTVSDVYCWGQNHFGQAGTGEVTGSTPGATLPQPRRADAAVRFRQVSVGADFTCALAQGGAAYCWGYNRPSPGGLGARVPGLLGVGAADSVVPRPAPVTGGLTFTAVTAGDSHACGLTADGAAWCWGDNLAGQLGDGRPATATCAGPADTACYAWSTRPRPVDTPVRFRELRAGHNATCGLALDGGLWCWGLAGVGAREEVFAGLTTGLVSRVPARIGAPATFATLASPPWGDVQGFGGPCGLDAGGALHCVRGAPPTATPVQPALSLAAAASPGWPFYGAACGLGTDGVARCWGSQAHGARGDGVLGRSGMPSDDNPTLVAGQR